MVADGIRHIPLLESYSGLNTAVSIQIPEAVGTQTRCGQILQIFQPMSASAAPYFPSSDWV